MCHNVSIFDTLVCSTVFSIEFFCCSISYLLCRICIVGRAYLFNLSTAKDTWTSTCTVVTVYENFRAVMRPACLESDWTRSFIYEALWLRFWMRAWDLHKLVILGVAYSYSQKLLIGFFFKGYAHIIYWLTLTCYYFGHKPYFLFTSGWCCYFPGHKLMHCAEVCGMWHSKSADAVGSI